MPEQIGRGASSDVAMGDPRVTANDFQMINETTQDANALELSLLYLQQSPYASYIIDRASGTSITFDRLDPNADQAFADGSGVAWNPEIALELSTGEYMSPAVNLASEFAHLVLPGGLDPNPTPDPVWSNSAEAVAHQAANAIAGELGEPERAGYADAALLLVSDPTMSFTSNYDIGFDAGAFASDYGIDFGFDSFGFDSFGSSSGGFDSFGFDYGSFAADYGIDFGFGSFDSFGGGGSGGGFSTDNYFEYVLLV